MRRTRQEADSGNKVVGWAIVFLTAAMFWGIYWLFGKIWGVS